MSRTATSKYGFWLAGSYEDWVGSKVIADDANQPSSAGTYDADKTHYGNILNGEATLSPRYRWSIRDRANNNEFSTATNYLASNDGISRWATLDPIRLGKGENWGGRAQLQYPNSLTNANRFRYDKAGNNNADDAYMLMSSSYNSSNRYYIPTGDTDSSFGRESLYDWNGRNWTALIAGQITGGTAPEFMQHASLTGVWMGERIQCNAYSLTTGAATTHEDTPEVIFSPIKSNSGKPFLCVTTYLADATANQINNVAPSGAYRPVIASSANLNTKSDGDFFTIRMCTQAMLGFASIVPDESVESGAPVSYTLKIGFPTSTTFGTAGSGGATPAINWTFRPQSGEGLSENENLYHVDWLASQDLRDPNRDPWYDLDFKIDYTNNKFKVYHEGTEVTATNLTAGAYTAGANGGYDMANNSDTSAAFKATEMTGWELFVAPLGTASNKCIVATMIDRFAVYRPLTDTPDNRGDRSPVAEWQCNTPVNGISDGTIKILDDDSEQNLTPWFLSDEITDWRLLMFSGNIHRPLWNGIIEGVKVAQVASDRTREITVTARDSLSVLDRQISSWEVGQVGLGNQDQVLARKEEIALLSDTMFFGAARLEDRQPTLGFESGTGYKQLEGQRATLFSAHPIQMYNNEDVAGPNNVEDGWLGYEVAGITQATASGDAQVILRHTGTSYTTSDTPDLFSFDDHNENGVTISAVGSGPTGFGQLLTISGMTYTGETSANFTGYQSTSPRTAAESGYLILRFSSAPSRNDNTFLSTGDLVTIPASETQVGTSFRNKVHTVIATQTIGGVFYAKTQTTTGALTPVTFSTGKYTIEQGKISGTAQDLTHRDAHAIWMRDLPKSAWFKKHFSVYGFSFVDAGTASASFTADSNVIQVGSSFIDSSESHGVGQVVNSAGFVDTFTYNGYISPADDGNHYLVGVKGLSIDHDSGETVYTLSAGTDYKHLWLQWADMRNNGDANADGGWRNKAFGLLKPVKDNYDVSISFTDQTNNNGEYDSFISMNIGQDLDIWELDATTDPTTNAPWSTPLGGGATIQLTNGYSGDSIISDGSTGIKFKVLNADSGVSDLATGDKVIIFNSDNYDGIHTISGITGTTTKEITCATSTYTTTETYTATGPFVRKAEQEHRVSELQGWEQQAGALLVYDCSKFFNLNTFINKGTINQRSGGTVSVGEYETEYHGFPVLMDNYWVQATSTNNNNAEPFAFNPNFRRWVNASAELNRTIEVGDKVIETKPSTSLVADFPEFGYGKIKCTRDASGQNPSTEIFWYTYDGKLDDAVVETATSNSAVAGALTIFCSGADFVNDGIKVGMRVRNVTAKWVAQITSLTATTIVVDDSIAGAETGSTRQNVNIGDSISIPQQLYGIYTQSDAATNYTGETAEALLEGIQMDDVIKANGSTAEIAVNLPNQSQVSGAYDEVVISGSAAPRYALRFLMRTEGYVSSPNLGTFMVHDKLRFLWSFTLSDTWLTQSASPCWFDLSSVPQTNNMTLDGTDADWDSFGGIYDGRGGKSLLSLVRESTEASGVGRENGKRLGLTYQMGRDNKLELRPSYSLGEALTRDSMNVNSLDASMAQQITNVRVYYNNGGSFSDYPAPSLNQTYRWKIIEVPEIGVEEEANLVAQEEYYKAKTKSIRITGNVMRDLTHDDKMLAGGRYGYIADPTRFAERSVTQQYAFGPAYPAVSNSLNFQWSSLNGSLANGQCNALDGHMSINGADTLNRDRYGKGHVPPAGSSAGTNHTYDKSYWWWGAHSLSHAVGIVHIPTDMPLVSDGSNEDLRIWVALKDGQTGTDIDNAEFTIGLTDPSFDTTESAKFNSHGGASVRYAPTYANTSGGAFVTTVNVKRNGFYQIEIPPNYWSSLPSGARITISVNVDYLKELLRHRCGDPSASGILHNAHDITEAGVPTWTATNTDSIFPLGLRKYENMSGLWGVRNVYYCPRIHITNDVRWRPATTVEFTDSGLGLSNETLTIQNIQWSVSGRDIEDVALSMERDQTKSLGGLGAYLYPSVARGRGQGSGSGTVGGSNGGSSNRPQLPPPMVPPSGGPVGTNPVAPGQQEGGRNPFEGNGTFTNSVGSNQLASGVHGRMTGRMDLLNNGVSDSSYGILGQTRVAPPLNAQRAVDGLGDNIQATSGTAVVSGEGMVFTGIVDPDSSTRLTQTHNISVKVPDDVADEIISVTAVYSLANTRPELTAVLTATVTEELYGNSVSRTFALSGGATRRTTAILGGTPLTGANTEGNTINIELKRTPGTGEDDALYASLVIHSIKVNFQRYSMKGIVGNGLNPY